MGTAVLEKDFLEYRFLSEVWIAPDGGRAAFVVRQADLDQSDYRSDVWVVDLSDGTVQQLTHSGKDGPFVWTPDGHAILLVSHRDGGDPGDSPVYRLAVDGGEARKVAAIPRKVEALRVFDEKTLLYTGWAPVADETPKGSEAYEILDEVPFWRNETKSFTNKQRLHLFRFDLETGNEQELAGGPLHVLSFGHHGGRIAFVAKEFVDVAPIRDQLWLLDMNTGSRECLSRDEYAFGGAGGQPNPIFLSEDLIAVMGTDMRRYGIRQSWEVLTFDLTNAKVGSLTPRWVDEQAGMPGCQRVASDCRHGAGPLSRVDGGRFYFPVTEGGSAFLYAVDRNGQLERVIGTAGSVDAFDVHDGRVVYVALRERALQELYVLEGGRERQLTSFNAGALAGRTPSFPEPFRFSSKDGTEIEAWLMKPANLSEDQSYPGILFVHGGPKAASGPVFYHELQVLAGKGYVLFFCNPRGSAGRGDAFGDLRGEYGRVDYDDVMALVDHVIEAFPFVDPERLGVMGHSYGGFMTNWIIGHTDRFRAACSHGSISNWHSFFCGTDLGYYFTPDQIAGTPWDEDAGEKLWWHSPLRYAHRAKTPTLFINSDRDHMTWPAEGIQMFTALRYHGVESRLILFHGENHDLSETGKPQNRLHKMQEVITWFDGHL